LTASGKKFADMDGGASMSASVDWVIDLLGLSFAIGSRPGFRRVTADSA
jgi:hypothetical protein